jgi:hypothetical protein
MRVWVNVTRFSLGNLPFCLWVPGVAARRSVEAAEVSRGQDSTVHVEEGAQSLRCSPRRVGPRIGAAGERIQAFVERFVLDTLRLTVNREKAELLVDVKFRRIHLINV